MLGKATIDTNTYGRSYGSHGSYSTNDQMAGRELLTPDEVRMLDNQYALLFIRGERPVKDLKYNLKEHPNASKEKIIDIPIEESDYELLSDEEIDNYIKEIENSKEKINEEN